MGDKPSRRAFLKSAFIGSGLLVVDGAIVACSSNEATGTGGGSATSGAGGQGGQGGAFSDPSGPMSNIANLGPLGEPDENGVRLPAGFTARVVARSGEAPVPSGAYLWHNAPDGGAVFPTPDGGWIYVSNAEVVGTGGVSALRFSPEGEVIDAYPILEMTNRNCAGGPTPWGTWLSCEEVDHGLVYECDPTGRNAAVALPALGAFSHEAVAVDPMRGHLYLTEDESNGRLYRFTPAVGLPDLTAGALEVCQVDFDTGAVSWLPLPDPTGMPTTTRLQVPESSSFSGGEGIWFHEDVVYFTTKGDDRVWALDVANQVLSVIYDVATSPTPTLTGVDNVTVSAGGDVLVAEDGGDLEIKAITPDNTLVDLVQLVGHDSSEIAGPAFTPDNQRLYFSSQRGTAGSSSMGITFEISGPFFV